MQPLHQLLSRLRWDPRFREGRYEIGYYDRLERRIVRVPFESIRFPRAVRFTFEIVDEESAWHRIPFHRVRRVWRDGRLIWERRPAADRAS
jgi:uncharacterized protein (UPF0248 family)